ncbi:hypothetical protein PACTADRAFT_17447 [Pachysolen tannophilus NRRL Y-2460]|uniref:Uncharacterized protein n=1 Tax=Pachysolen tannophilus NRRL Y-2460 TaxID=669874 RepID=A0A1E4TSL7_PACTA|nr:hypothetical protein PACTADRAFT_17447 [Pachysolen tannophilus NRRL Y-2460]
MSAVIGIAFGNTSSSIAVANVDGKVDVIANPDGDRAISSTLSYVGEDEYHGNQALSQLVRNPDSTIINFRDFVGLSYSEIDAETSNHSALPIDINGQIGYQINDKKITIDEVVKRNLKQVKLAAEDYIGKPIEGVVLTVPTNFTDAQNSSLKKISNDAGLKVLQLISEPSAALLAHLSADEERFQKDKLYVVADFGGIRSDAAVIAVRSGILTVLATAHDLGLGGEKLDDALAEFFAKEFEKKYKSNPRNNRKAMAKLKAACIITKKTLSNVQSSTISIDSLSDGYDFHSTINRLRYELVTRDVLSKMAAFTEIVVKKAGLETIDIDEVLLAGGVSHTPKLASNIQFLFPESTVVIAPSLDTKVIDPSELLCRGAALQASMIETFDDSEIEEAFKPHIVNTQHIQKPIGVRSVDGSFIEILPKETAYPIRKTVLLKGKGDVLIEVYEGDRTVKETTIEPEKQSGDEDDEEEYSDEEPETIREVVYVPGEKLADLALKGANGEVEVILDINKDGKLTVSGRSGDVTVKGSI